MEREILVLGAGVSGLSTGILLLQKGYKVTIWEKDIPPYTTSNKAAAVWYPFICGPLDKATEWGRVTLDFFRSEILPVSVSGCRKTSVVEIFTGKKEDPWWSEGVDTYKRISKDKLPEGYKDGYEVEGVVMDTDVYMRYLVKTFISSGGQIWMKEVKDIREALYDNPLVVNCTGLGSRTLFHDKKVYPTRGQIVKIKPNGFDYSLFEEEGPNSLAYIIPRLNDIVLGGTAQKNNWSLEVSEQDTKEILQKCAAILPQFKKVEITDIGVGLRPTRDEVRLEVEKHGSSAVIHNYGHGGAGFTLSWGCAQNAVALVDSVVRDLSARGVEHRGIDKEPQPQPLT